MGFDGAILCNDEELVYFSNSNYHDWFIDNLEKCESYTMIKLSIDKIKQFRDDCFNDCFCLFNFIINSKNIDSTKLNIQQKEFKVDYDIYYLHSLLNMVIDLDKIIYNHFNQEYFYYHDY